MAQEGRQEPPVPVMSHLSAVQALTVHIEETVEAPVNVLVMDLTLQLDGLLHCC